VKSPRIVVVEDVSGAIAEPAIPAVKLLYSRVVLVCETQVCRASKLIQNHIDEGYEQVVVIVINRLSIDLRKVTTNLCFSTGENCCHARLRKTRDLARRR